MGDFLYFAVCYTGTLMVAVVCCFVLVGWVGLLMWLVHRAHQWWTGGKD